MSNIDTALHSPHGYGRKYLNQDERQRFLASAQQLPAPHRLFAEVLAWTGARISEALALVPASFDLDAGSVTLPTLKRRRPAVRVMPLPPALLRELTAIFDLRAAQRDPDRAQRPLWQFCRVTGWRIIKRVMSDAGIIGIQATPRGLRHGFGVATLRAGVPITLLKRWLGHARLSTTEIYTNVIGKDEVEFASRFWSEQKGRSAGTAKQDQVRRRRRPSQNLRVENLFSRIEAMIAHIGARLSAAMRAPR